MATLDWSLQRGGRRWQRRFIALGGLLLLALPSVTAVERNVPLPVHETVSILDYDLMAYNISLSARDTLAFRVRVTQGGPIDVYLMPAKGYFEYLNPKEAQFTYFVNSSRENVTDFSGDFHPSAGGNYYLLLDNTDTSVSGAQPTGQVVTTVDITLPGRIDLGTILAEYPFVVAAVVGGVGGAAVGILALLLHVRLKQGRGVPPVTTAPLEAPSQDPSPEDRK